MQSENYAECILCRFYIKLLVRDILKFDLSQVITGRGSNTSNHYICIGVTMYVLSPNTTVSHIQQAVFSQGCVLFPSLFTHYWLLAITISYNSSQGISLRTSLPKGVARGCPDCSNCVKVDICHQDTLFLLKL